eukprot:TRINITY_DN666_c0_g1_i1.p1 TRINITY_DN666_c0_g1~~TRINITY_DN666_c0_g1_i1.p1  ORF type:complete len:356 (-),score=71.97 TRINITY_DN666_c0_g1_i1:176-1243(-)
MGCGASKSEETIAQEKASKEADKELRVRKAEMASEIKLLLLGTGESGKSTIAKQMKILHTDGYSTSELASYRPIVYNNIVSAMKTLIAAAETFGYQLQPENQGHAKLIIEVVTLEVDSITPEMSKAVSSLWQDPAIKQTIARSSEFHLIDSAGYCFDNVERMASPDYIPTKDDVLHVRARTTGIVEISFRIKEHAFRMIDVGGQRSERKKWIHCFEDVTAIIYCVALNEYDQKLYEDETVNRMVESLELFEQIVNSRWFTKTAVVLFLNKSDLFKDKIAKVPLSNLFPDYPGGADFGQGVAFIEKAFVLRCRTANKRIFTHVTCATDTSNVEAVFSAVKEVIIAQNLERLGFGAL